MYSGADAIYLDSFAVSLNGKNRSQAFSKLFLRWQNSGGTKKGILNGLNFLLFFKVTLCFVRVLLVVIHVGLLQMVLEAVDGHLLVS